MPTKSLTLVAWNGCGCMSLAIKVDGDTMPQDLARFRKEALKRNCRVVEYPPGSEIPPWECDEHHEARLSRIK